MSWQILTLKKNWSDPEDKSLSHTYKGVTDTAQVTKNLRLIA